MKKPAILLFMALLSIPASAQGIFCLIGKNMEIGAAFFNDSVAPQVVLGREKLSGCAEQATNLYVCDYKGMRAKFDLEEAYMEFDGRYRFDLRQCRPI